MDTSDRIEQMVGPRKPVPSDRYQEHGQNAEMLWGSVEARDYLTPTDSFFVRSQSTTPVIDAERWQVAIDGPAVNREIAISYPDLLSLPQVEYVRALECAGNGRRFFESTYGLEAEGNQWGLGAVGVARWSGPRLRDVLELAGVGPGAQFVVPEGLDADRVRRPMPLSKALEEDTLVALTMNGEPLRVDHGFPARVIVSGWAAVASIKWLGRITVTTEPVWTRWNTELYVMDDDTGTTPDPIEEQVVKSTLELAWEANLSPGPQTIGGRAWSPHGCVAHVDYSIDDGPWRRAQMVEPNFKRAWVRFRLKWNATPGAHTIRTRAVDDSGNTQPEDVAWNRHGYLYAGVIAHPVSVTVQPDPG